MPSPDKNEETLFAEALARPASERPAFLDQACRDDAALRTRLSALLAAHETPESVLAPPATPLTLRPEERAGDRIGRYKLLQKIGEGGCGVVYMADQQEPVHRRVALKVIKLGMDTREVIARFEAERQALALMDHPNIARVFDAGATASGRPFFVMELVRGVRITEYCDTHNVSTAQRLELFIQVCHAVQHAHQKGIIHRDLKPSNILVTINDDVPVPKIIDFGIAKATQGRLTDQTVFTAFEQFIGTPAYMSPEQAVMTSLDIDTRTDIYSLGVLLYELLTGRTPFDTKTLLQAGLDEIRRFIREVEPPKPSSRLSTMEGDTLTVTAHHRHTEPPKLISLVRGDLDWIVMKAMEKDRIRRYDTPTALAADLARHLKHEPVVARPPTTVYRTGRFIRRHRIGFTAIVCVALTLVAGTSVSTWQAVCATRAERRAVAESQNAALARDEAQRRRAESEKLLFFMLGDLRERLLSVGRLDLMESVVDQANEYVAGLKGSDLNDVARLGQVKTLSWIGAVRVDQKRFSEAMSVLADVYELASQLSARQPANADILFERAQIEYRIGFVHRRRSEDEAHEKWLRRYRESAIALVNLDPKNPRSQQEFVFAQNNLAVWELERGNLVAAHAGMTAKLAMVEQMLIDKPKDSSLRASLATTYSWFGLIAERRGNFPEALERYRAQTALLDAMSAESPSDRERRFKVAVSQSLQVEVLLITGRLAEARELLARALGDFEALVAHDPANRRWLINLLAAQLHRIALERAEGRLALAGESLNQIRPKIDTLVAAEPTDRIASAMAVTAWWIEAELRLAARRSDAADAAGQAVSRAEQFLKEARVEDKPLGECAFAFLAAGHVAEAVAQRETALRHWQRALALLEPRLANSNDRRLLEPAARALALLGRVDDSRAIIARLERLGYRPLQSWP